MNHTRTDQPISASLSHMAEGKKINHSGTNFIQKRKQAALLVGGLPAFVELFYGNDKKEVYAKSLD
ncbi:MAG: hypothetical protein ACLTBZ_08680 [Faecalispora jeddahensis]|uniref:hypothetical protein n=1 Tax=Eubacteriales TaxID=186802 RepID=UPI00026F3004|nr:hypothetical protein [Clostridium sp. MSTE9]EJF38939.1 hypothetical protein HMPREF1141_2130 [Clostridium sp. MSTE9]MBE6742753.1 hypothetical protein [Oscillospiraceae bacterium]MBS5782405.1 hypothetical protein [Clostridium sp.]